MNDTENILAIVIPAFRLEFFKTALDSIANQTNKRFTVYIGDDNSPENLKEVVDEYLDKININYKKFEINLGSKDLVDQWARCVKLINNEQWIWLFSDDDIADETCVEEFYKTLLNVEEEFDVYRFNTRCIDAYGNVTYESKESPRIENAMSLALNILLGNRGNSMPDHVFKVAKYQELNGFVNFIQGQASDWATSIKYAHSGNGLYTIPGPKISWRYSGKNISSLASKNKNRLIYGHLQFIEWIVNKFTLTDEDKYRIKINDIIDASKINFKNIILTHYKGIPIREILNISKIISRIYKDSFVKSLWFCLEINYTLKTQKYQWKEKYYSIRQRILNRLK